MFREKSAALIAYVKKEERFQISNFSFFKELGKAAQTKPTASRWKE